MLIPAAPRWLINFVLVTCSLARCALAGLRIFALSLGVAFALGAVGVSVGVDLQVGDPYQLGNGVAGCVFAAATTALLARLWRRHHPRPMNITMATPQIPWTIYSLSLPAPPPLVVPRHVRVVGGPGVGFRVFRPWGRDVGDFVEALRWHTIAKGQGSPSIEVVTERSWRSLVRFLLWGLFLALMGVCTFLFASLGALLVGACAEALFVAAGTATPEAGGILVAQVAWLVLAASYLCSLHRSTQRS